MVKSTSKERRSWLRNKRVLSIEYRLVKNRQHSTDLPWNLSTTDNVSAQGLAFYSDIEYRKGDILELRIVMPGIVDVFTESAEVIRIDQKRSGASFLVVVLFIGQVIYTDSQNIKHNSHHPHRSSI